MITGSSRGIGRAIAEELARLDFEVTVHGKAASQALEQSLASVINCGSKLARSISFDVSDRAAATQALADEVSACGAFYGVVCSAGIVADAPFPALSAEQWDSVIGTNLGGFYNVLHPLVLPMIQRRDGGRIICLSSVSGLIGNRGQVNYSASKAALIGATKALARELAKRNITVNCIAPGPVETEMLDATIAQEMLKAIPMQRFAKLDEVAATAGFLFSERAGYMTGQTLVLSGGLI